MKRFISDHGFRLFNAAVGRMPRGLLRRLLRTLHIRPDVAAAAGYQVYPDVFYNPFPVARDVDGAQLKLRRPLPGIEFNPQKFQELTATLARQAAEVEQFLKARTINVAKWDITYPRGDTATLYAMLRHLKPRRYIEVGCGYSSLTSSSALNRNADEGHACAALYIEPYPPAHLAAAKLPGEFLQQKVQQVPLARFQQLEAGDVLFIDTSHVIKVQNDVEFELLRILPSLKAGVLVHIHDIFTPYDYPAEWLVGTDPNRGGNNEQYALECLLSGGSDWEVVLPVYLLWKEHPSWLNQLVQADYRPAAFWIRKTR